jgi:hypothetical protein
MSRLSRFFRLSGAERVLLIQATILLVAIRLGLRALRFARLRNLLARLGRTRNRPEDQLDAAARDRTIWAVETVSRQFPAIGTCLMQALAIHALLARQGYDSNLRIGVTRDSDGKFMAHAWLEKNGVILIGESGHQNYTPLPL